MFVSVHLDPVHPPRAISLEFISQEKTFRKVWGDAAAFTAESPQDDDDAGPLPSVGEYAVLELTAAEAGLEEGKDYTGLRLAQSGGQAWWDHVGAEIPAPARKPIHCSPRRLGQLRIFPSSRISANYLPSP